MIEHGGAISEHVESLARHDAEIAELRRWQERQNGSILRIEERLNLIAWGVAASALGVLGQLLGEVLRK